jgi:hypothetical protein
MEWKQAILFIKFVHHPQFGPACIHSSHDLVFAFKHSVLSVKKKEK